METRSTFQRHVHYDSSKYREAPVSECYVIDPVRQVVTCRVWGVFTNAELTEHYRRLVADPAFDPGYAQLADLRDVTEFAVDSALIESTARESVFAAGTARAFVAPKGVAFGLARMFTAYAPEDQAVRVFERMEEAETWLLGVRER